MIFNSTKRPRPVLPVAISQPIRYYTKDTLHFNDSSKDQLYGEIYSKECLEQYKDEALTAGSSLPPRANSIWEILLYTSTIFLSLTSLILYAIIIPLWEKNFEHTRSPVKGDWTDGLLLLPLSLSFLSATTMVFRAIRERRARHRGQNPRHASPSMPFYTILLSSTLVLLLAPLLILASTNSLARAFRPDPAPNKTLANGALTCNRSNVLTKPCIPILYRIGELQIGGAVTAGLVCSLWITILILSMRKHFQIKAEEERQSREQKQRRHARRKARREARRAREEDRATNDEKAGCSDPHRSHSVSTKLPPQVFQSRRSRADQAKQATDQMGRLVPPSESTYQSSEQIIGLPRPERVCRPRESLQSWMARQRPLRPAR